MSIFNSSAALNVAVQQAQPVVAVQPDVKAWILLGDQEHFLGDNARNKAVSHILGIRKDLMLCPLAIARIKVALPLTIPLGPNDREYVNESKGGVRPPTPKELSIIHDTALKLAYPQYNLHWVSCPTHASKVYVYKILVDVLIEEAFWKSPVANREIQAPMLGNVSIAW